MLLEEWRKSGREFDYNGHPIFFRDEGNGPALLCIHGFPTSSWDWQKIWFELTKRFRVISPDMIGFGDSAKPRDYSYSILDQADLHEELLGHLHVKDVVVLAHDYGDTVAQELLARSRNRSTESGSLQLRGVCLLNGGLFPERHRARLIQKLLVSPLGPLLARLSSERQFSRSLSAIFGAKTQPTATELHDFWLLHRHNKGHLVTPSLLSYLRERRDYRERWVGALVETSIPIRFINGTDDPVSGRHMAERFRELVPNADVVLLEGIGHYPQVEDPARVLREFFAFADRISLPGS